MIGGEPAVVRRLDAIFAALAPGIPAAPRTPGREKLGGTAERGYLHCGSNGAGHFVKMVHNGIEYGIMAAYSEGLNILRHANIGIARQVVDAETTPLRNPEHYQYEIALADVAEVWRRGSVIASWLLDLTAAALTKDSDLAGFEGRVSDSGEGRWTLAAAIDEAVPAPVLSAATSMPQLSASPGRRGTSRPSAPTSARAWRSLDGWTRRRSRSSRTCSATSPATIALRRRGPRSALRWGKRPGRCTISPSHRACSRPS